jgi:nucleoside-diphosphate-sugar epimerase
VKVLVTGANGFLGRHVVAALLDRGHAVKVLLRPRTELGRLPWAQRVEVHRGDLRSPSTLEGALDGVETLVHLAGSPAAGAGQLFASAVVGTETLVGRMRESGVRRMVLASSFSVYDLAASHSPVNEQAPLRDAARADGDGYSRAKLWQERVARRASLDQDFDLVVLRPGLLWESGRTAVPSMGLSLGPVHVSVGPRTRLRLVHVENAAAAFAAAVERPEETGATINLVDPDTPTAWRHLGECLRRDGGGVRAPVPYAVAAATVAAVHRLAVALLGPAARLPAVLVPARFAARFKPLTYSTDAAAELLGWRPPVTYREGLQRPLAGPDDS